MPSHGVEPLFDGLTEKRILPIGQSRGDLRPILTLQSLNRRRKEFTIFHGNMGPFVLDEVANDAVDGLPPDFPIRQYTLDCLRHPLQTFGAAPVLGREIANICSRRGIARFQLLEYNVLLGMMVGTGIDQEIGDNRVDNHVVRPLSAIKDA